VGELSSRDLPREAVGKLAAWWKSGTGPAGDDPGGFEHLDGGVFDIDTEKGDVLVMPNLHKIGLVES